MTNTLQILTLSCIMLFSSSCTHTAYFTPPPEQSKNFLPATSRNLENYQLEKELAQSRTASGYLFTAGGVLGIVGIYAAVTENNLNAISLLSISATTAIWGRYFDFLASRAEAYLEGAGVRILSWNGDWGPRWLSSEKNAGENERQKAVFSATPAKATPPLRPEVGEQLPHRTPSNLGDSIISEKKCLVRKCVGMLCRCLK